MSLNDRSVIFSGIQPTGSLHLGNYLGAIKNWVNLQKDPKYTHRYFCIVDLHATTIFHESSSSFYQKKLELAKILLACGIDPMKSTLYCQSDLSEHSELAWILSCITPKSWLNQMIQFKEKSKFLKSKKVGKHNLEEEKLGLIMSTDVESSSILSNRRTSDLDGASLGLYQYPILMAADILLFSRYHGKKVDLVIPVGEDQRQHLELTRDVARRFNLVYQKDYFPIPKDVYVPLSSRVMSLRDGVSKMSKSDPLDNSRINLTDTEEAIRHKITKAITDSIEGVTYDEEKRPQVSNLIGIYAALEDMPVELVVKRYEGKDMSQFKKGLIDVILNHVMVIRERLSSIENNPNFVKEILVKGKLDAKSIAQETLEEIHKIVGYK